MKEKKLELPIKTESFVSKISKPQTINTKKIVSSSPALLNIPNENEYVKMAPLPTFQGSYTNFVKKDRRLTFNSKYRDIDFGLSKMDFLEQNQQQRK